MEGTVCHRKAAAPAVINDEKRGEKFSRRKLSKDTPVTVCLLVCELLGLVISQVALMTLVE